MPENTTALPDNYSLLMEVALQKDKKTAVLVNVFAVVLMVLCIVPMFFIYDIPSLIADYFDNMDLRSMLLTISTVIGILVYLILHELTHGAVMYLMSHVKPRYGFTGVYAYAGSDVYFNKRSYIIIGLAPVILWGVVLTLCMIFIPSWFWVYFSIQVMNISGSAGDIYISAKTARMDKGILVRDTGVEMSYYINSVHGQ